MDWNRAGTEVVTGDSKGNVDLWRATGSNYTRVPGSRRINVGDPVESLALSPDTSRVAVVTDDNNGEIQILSTRTGKQLQQLNADYGINTVTFSPDGNQVLAGDNNGQVEVWKGTAQNPLLLGASAPGINDLEFNNSGTEFVTAAGNGLVTVWNARDDQTLLSINACLSPFGAGLSPSTARFSPDGSQIVVACGNGTVPVFDVSTGQELTIFLATTAGSVTSAAFSPDGKSIVAGVESGNFGCVQVWKSELAIPSLPALEQVARQRLTSQLTTAEENQYLTGINQ